MSKHDPGIALKQILAHSQEKNLPVLIRQLEKILQSL